MTVVGGPGKLLQKVSTSAYVNCANSMRDGVLFGRLMVGRQHRSRALYGLFRSQPEHSVGTRGFGVVGMLVPAGNRLHTEQQHRDHRVDVRRHAAPIPDCLAQRLGQAETPFCLAWMHQADVGGDQVLSKPAVTFLRRMTGTSKERGLWSGVAGVRLSLLVKKDSSTTNLHTGETHTPARANPRLGLGLGQIVRNRRLACSSKFFERNRSQ